MEDFVKAEGLGNDFVLVRVEDPATHEPPAGEVSTFCDRHRGVGADGLVAVGPVRHGRVRVRFWNADGSLAGNCGNAVRCVLVSLGRHGEVAPGQSIEVEADGGVMEARLLQMDGPRGEVTVRMPRVRFEPDRVPVRAEAPLRDAWWQVGRERVRLTALSVGNPHVVLLDPDVDDARWEEVARHLERDPRFPERVNVGFARTVGGDRLRLRVWERGVGWTEACGTGACAAAVAFVQGNWRGTERSVRVEQPGGALRVTVQEDGVTWMQGPARVVFTGRWAWSPDIGFPRRR